MLVSEYMNHKNKFVPKYILNTKICASNVLCIDQNNVNCGVISLTEAINKARTAGLDLIQVAQNGNTPTCRIVDFGKFKYEESKKDRQIRKRQRESLSKIKEIKFRPSTDENDLRTKAKQAQEFVDDGHKLKITLTFKGRELKHRDVANDTLQKFLGMLPDVTITNAPIMSGRTLSVFAARKSVENRRV